MVDTPFQLVFGYQTNTTETLIHLVTGDTITLSFQGHQVADQMHTQ